MFIYAPSYLEPDCHAMKTIEDLKHYFERDLKAQLNSLEAKRLQVVNRYSFKPYKRFLKIAGLLCVASIVLAINLPETFRLAPIVIPVCIVIAIVHPLVILYKRSTHFERVNKECKESIVPKLLKFIDPEMSYHPEKGMAREDFNNCSLFTRKQLSSYLSDDLIEYKVGDTSIQIAHVVASVPGNKSKGQSSGSYEVFSGLFTRTHYPIGSQADIIVKKDARNNMLANAGKAVFGDALGGLIDTVVTKVEALNITGDLVKFDDLDFEAQFNVYCSEPDTAKRILHDKVRKVVTAYAKQNNQDVHFSFTSNHLNIAFWCSKYFEWETNDSFLDFEKFKAFLFPLLLSVDLVNTLVQEKR